MTNSRIVKVIRIGMLLVLVGIGSVWGQPKKNTENKADKNLKSSAKVNPSTLAMEFEIPLMSYSGRGGNGLPIGISYSSKVWRMEQGLNWWTTTPFGATIYHTQVNPKFGERSAAGWTSSLLSPHIVEKLDLYDQMGEPLTRILSENQANSLNQGNNINTMQMCYRNCEIQQYGPDGWICNLWGDWRCSPIGGCTAAEECGGGDGTGTGGNPPVPPPPPPYYVKRVRIQMPNGSTHEFRKDDNIHPYCPDPTNLTRCNGQYGEDKTGTFLAVDGSGMRLERGVSYEGETRDILYLPNGSRYIFSNSGTGSTMEGYFRPAEKYIDIDGNKSTYNPTERKWTDTMGRTISDILPQNWYTQTQSVGTQHISLPGLNNQPSQNYHIKWENLKDVLDVDLLVIDKTLSYWTKQNCNLSTNPATTSGTDKLFSVTDVNTYLCNPKDQNGNVVRFDPVVLSEVQLPNAKKYKLKYNRFGEITKIEYPTGSYERFQYKQILPIGNSFDLTYDQTNRGIEDRWLYNANGGLEQHWHYEAELENSVYVVTITNPDGSISKRSLNRTASLNFGFDNILSGVPIEEKSYDSNGILRSKTLNNWTWKSSTATPINSAMRDARPSRSVTFTFDPSSPNFALANFSKTEYDEGGNANPEYFSHLNVKTVKSYDFAVVPISQAQTEINWTTIEGWFAEKLDKVSETDYLYDPLYQAKGINSLLKETQVKDKAGNLLAKTQTIYDNYTGTPSTNYPFSEPIHNYSGITTSLDCSDNPATPKICWENPNNPYRRHPTTSRVWNNDDNSWIETHAQTDMFGNGIKAVDAIGNQAETEFSPEFKYAYPTKTITPAPDPDNSGHGTNQTSTTQTSYDFTTGLPLEVTDDFGQKIKTEYDQYLRPFRTSGVNVNVPISETFYDDVNLSWVKVRKQIDETNWDEAITYTDSLGRTTKTVAKDSQGDVIVETKYDVLGRVKATSNPYRSGETVYWSKPRYDELNRVVETFAPAPEGQTGASLGITEWGVSTEPDFVGTFTIATDASGRKARSITNSLGQLIRIDEPTGNNDLGSLAAPNQPTFYKYNQQGKMVKVSQGQQNRFFLYDSLGRLIRVRQPEQEVNTGANGIDKDDPITGNNQWTAAFEYDFIGNLIKTTDAEGKTITNTYDKAGRVKVRTYSDTNTPTVYYYYDGLGLATPPPSTNNFAKGKLTKVMSSISTTQFTQFDNFGRNKVSEQLTDGQTYQSKYKYDFGGRLIEQTYPSEKVVRNFFENDGDLTKIVRQGKVYASDFSYSATGKYNHLKLGNGRWESWKYNSRDQLTEIALGTQVGDGSLWKQNYEYGELNQNGTIDLNKNTGNIAKITNTFNGLANPFIQTFRYDAIDRITEATENNGTTRTWKQTWNYDRFGNRSAFNSQAINQTTINTTPQIDPNTNRFVSGVQYDKTGNIVQDIVDNQVRNFVFNGDNKQVHVKDANDVAIGTYYYDGNGARVKKVTQSETTIFVYDGGGLLVAEYSTATPTQTPTVSYTATDTLGSPRVITDKQGNVTSRRDFMPFGEELNPDGTFRRLEFKFGSPTDNIRKRFTGYEKDEETQLDYAQARYYNNKHGRFTAVDPLLASGKNGNPQTFNRYAYTMNQPLILTDKTGLQSEPGEDVGEDETIRIDTYWDSAKNAMGSFWDYMRSLGPTLDSWRNSESQNFSIRKNNEKSISRAVSPINTPLSKRYTRLGTPEDAKKLEDTINTIDQTGIFNMMNNGWKNSNGRASNTELGGSILGFGANFIPGGKSGASGGRKIIALGMETVQDSNGIIKPLLKPFAEAVGAISYHNNGWVNSGITRRSGARFGRVFNDAVKNADEIRFSLDGVTDLNKALSNGRRYGFVSNYQRQNMTNAELYTVFSNESVLNKTTFYVNNQPVPRPSVPLWLRPQ